MKVSFKIGACRALATVFTFSLLSGIPLHATTVLYMPFEEQCSSAGLIVLATAAEQISNWDTGRNLIFTETRFQVEEALKGSAGSTVLTRHLGGRVGDIAQDIAGTPEFKIGRRYVLFLEPGPGGFYRVVGFHQGCYPVVSGKDGKARIAPRLAAEGGAEPHLLGAGAADAAAGEQALSDFLARIRNYLKQSGR
ncbi:MAG: hypothetical protein A2Z86_06030 [Candidatus Glassbacteria bacterium GWA2_58_10]|uniref:Uncharacterized protein n=1 Tax=Candidatus Glassbacteria bacterium GWA2_58_10 TaxID=1817865 RepID=A0A1F5YD02_9BACT|nr:MAG: hypothetical protein A2Z86_06030 [Candidatus Glassbacteria bacterium GWA2_58_10]